MIIGDEKMISKENFKQQACDILYSSGDPENIDKDFMENLLAELLCRIDRLEKKMNRKER